MSLRELTDECILDLARVWRWAWLGLSLYKRGLRGGHSVRHRWTAASFMEEGRGAGRGVAAQAGATSETGGGAGTGSGVDGTGPPRKGNDLHRDRGVGVAVFAGVVAVSVVGFLMGRRAV